MFNIKKVGEHSNSLTYPCTHRNGQAPVKHTEDNTYQGIKLKKPKFISNIQTVKNSLGKVCNKEKCTELFEETVNTCNKFGCFKPTKRRYKKTYKIKR